MKFNFERWKAVVLAADEQTAGAEALLEAAGLIGSHDLENELADLLREIEADLDEAKRAVKDGSPDGDTA